MNLVIPLGFVSVAIQRASRVMYAAPHRYGVFKYGSGAIHCKGLVGSLTPTAPWVYTHWSSLPISIGLSSGKHVR